MRRRTSEIASAASPPQLAEEDLRAGRILESKLRAASARSVIAVRVGPNPSCRSRCWGRARPRRACGRCQRGHDKKWETRYRHLEQPQGRSQ
jgi:hypothetical protein